MINDSTRRALYSKNNTKVFCTVLEITAGETVLHLIDDCNDLMINGAFYQARGFTFVPPAPDAEDASADITLDDTDNTITPLLDGCSSIPTVSIGTIRRDQASVWVEGPYSYRVSGFARTSKSGELKLNMTRMASLDATAGRVKYSTETFPGLYG